MSKGVGKNSDRVCGQKITSSECRVGWSVVVMEKPVVTSPQFWPFASDGVPHTFQYFNEVNLVCCGDLRKILVMINIKNSQHYLDIRSNLASFLGLGNPLG